MCVCVYIYIYIYNCLHRHVYIYIHIYIYIYIHLASIKTPNIVYYRLGVVPGRALSQKECGKELWNVWGLGFTIGAEIVPNTIWGVPYSITTASVARLSCLSA